MNAPVLDLGAVRERVLRAIAPIEPAGPATVRPQDYEGCVRTGPQGSQLPHPSLIYLTLVDLLGFQNWGQEEKVAWSIPIDYSDHGFVLEHRKLGMALLSSDSQAREQDTHELVQRLEKGVRAARPYFDYRAQLAISKSEINVINQSKELWARYEYLRALHQEKLQEAVSLKEQYETTEVNEGGLIGTVTVGLWYEPERQVRWIAYAAIEAFFRWAEHVLVLVAILTGRIQTGDEVAKLIKNDWSRKFKKAIDLASAEAKQHYDNLYRVREELRNFLAHGAFGKQGECFRFHSRAGAVPVALKETGTVTLYELMTDTDLKNRQQSASSAEQIALDQLDEFCEFLWSEERAPARLYVEDGVDIFLNFSESRAKAMHSEEEMTEYLEWLNTEIDRAANMDW